MRDVALAYRWRRQNGARRLNIRVLIGRWQVDRLRPAA